MGLRYAAAMMPMKRTMVLPGIKVGRAEGL